MVEMALIMKYIATKEDVGITLGDFLLQQQLSKKAIIALKHRGGKICVNNESRTTRWQLQNQDLVTVTFPDEQVSLHLKPVQMELNIVYEDAFLLVVDKKEGLPVMATGNCLQALANGILAHYEEIELASTVHFVNRLDRGTSGLLIVAKYRHIHHLMKLEMSKVTRKYYALVTEIMIGKGVIEAPIFRPDMNSIKRVVDERGQYALTDYEVVENFSASTLVKCRLETGRTHQIRVHLAHLGHPILKDPLYGDAKEEDLQLLHSYFVEFVHPITNERLVFETGVPDRFGI